MNYNTKINKLHYINGYIKEIENKIDEKTKEGLKIKFKCLKDLVEELINEEKIKMLGKRGLIWVNIKENDEIKRIPAKILDIDRVKCFITVNNEGRFEVREYFTSSKVSWGWTKEKAIEEATSIIKNYFQNHSYSEFMQKVKEMGIINEK
ncbi:MAG: hypothetical protein NC921_03940 [Candidatus Omnitrophica bacterium]|nr:hypothetical protein [Candidatus Omnitrophota bacterium]